MKNQNYVLLIILCLAVVAFLYYSYRVKIKEGAQGDDTEEATGDDTEEATGDDIEEATEDAADEPTEDAADEPTEDAADDAGDDTSGAKRSKKDPQQNIGGTKPSSGVQKISGMQQVGNQPNVGVSQSIVGGNQPMLNPYEGPRAITGYDIEISSSNNKSIGSVVEEIEDDLDKVEDDLDKEIPSLSRRINALDKRIAAQERLASKPSGKAQKK